MTTPMKKSPILQDDQKFALMKVRKLCVFVCVMVNEQNRSLWRRWEIFTPSISFAQALTNGRMHFEFNPFNFIFFFVVTGVWLLLETMPHAAISCAPCGHRIHPKIGTFYLYWTKFRYFISFQLHLDILMLLRYSFHISRSAHVRTDEYYHLVTSTYQVCIHRIQVGSASVHLILGRSVRVLCQREKWK